MKRNIKIELTFCRCVLKIDISSKTFMAYKNREHAALSTSATHIILTRLCKRVYINKFIVFALDDTGQVEPRRSCS